MKESLCADDSALLEALGPELKWRNFAFAVKPGALRDLVVRSRKVYAVDWMDFCITLQSPSQFRHVQARLTEVWGKLYVTPVDGPASSKSFVLRIHNPPGPEQFLRELQAMARPGEPAITEDDVIVVGVEIALDVYVPSGNRQLLALVGTYLLRHQAHPPEGLPRITSTHKAAETDSTQEIFEAFLSGESTIHCGPQGSDRACRFYLKDYDTVDGVPYAKLPPDQWRARFENTLKGPALPFTTIGGWRKCRFEKALADLFALVVPDPKHSTFLAAMEHYRLQLGRRPDSFQRRSSDRVKRGALTLRDSQLNDQGRQQLRALTRAHRRRNSVNIDLPDNSSSLESSDDAGTTPRYCITTTGSALRFLEQEGNRVKHQSLLTMGEVPGSSTLDNGSVNNREGNSYQLPVRRLNQLSLPDEQQETQPPKSQRLLPSSPLCQVLA